MKYISLQKLIMIEIELEFNLESHPMDENVKKFWTLPDQQGFTFFKKVTKDILPFLNKGEILENNAIINNNHVRNILHDFKTNQFLIEEKRAVAMNSASQVFVKLKPII